MIRLITKLNPKIDNVLQCHMQAGDISTNLDVKIYFNLPVFSATEL